MMATRSKSVRLTKAGAACMIGPHGFTQRIGGSAPCDPSRFSGRRTLPGPPGLQLRRGLHVLFIRIAHSS